MDIHDRPYQVPRDPNYMRHAGRQGNNDECGGCCVRMGASNEGMGEGSRTGVWWTGVVNEDERSCICCCPYLWM